MTNTVPGDNDTAEISYSVPVRQSENSRIFNVKKKSGSSNENLLYFLICFYIVTFIDSHTQILVCIWAWHQGWDSD